MATVVTLRTTDVTAYVIDGTLRPGPHDLWAHVRLAALRLKAATPVVPAMDDFLKITQTGGSAVRFAGLVKLPDKNDYTRVGIDYDVAGQGWETALDKVNVTTGMVLPELTSDMVLVQDALDTFYSQLATTGTSHKLYPSAHELPFKRVPSGAWSFRDLMDWIVEQTGAPWWIDPGDKSFHYNDFEQAAPWVLSDGAEDSSHKGFLSFAKRRDAVGRAMRVTVTDGAGNSYTATDWEAWADLAAKIGDEPGAPGDRFPQLPDVIDSTLDTAAKLKRKAFALLGAERGRTIISATVRAEGLEIGQMLDVINSSIGTETTPELGLDQWEIGVTSATEDLDTGLGRFMVSKISPRSEVGRDVWVWEIEAGDPNEMMAALLARGGNR